MMVKEIEDKSTRRNPARVTCNILPTKQLHAVKDRNNRTNACKIILNLIKLLLNRVAIRVTTVISSNRNKTVIYYVCTTVRKRLIAIAPRQISQ